MKYCKKCGAILKKGYSFCGRCGRKYIDQLKQRPPMNPGSLGEQPLTSLKPNQSLSSASLEPNPSSPSASSKPEPCSLSTSTELPSSISTRESETSTIEPEEKSSLPPVEVAKPSSEITPQDNPHSAVLPIGESSSITATTALDESSENQSSDVQLTLLLESLPVPEPPSVLAEPENQTSTVPLSQENQASPAQPLPASQASPPPPSPMKQTSPVQTPPGSQSSPKPPTPVKTAISKDAAPSKKKSRRKKTQLRVILVVALVCILLVLLVISILMQSASLDEAEGEVLTHNVEVETQDVGAKEEGEGMSGAEPEETDGVEPDEVDGVESAEQEVEVPDIVVVLEDVFGRWLWVHEDRNEEDLAFNLITHYFAADGTGERSINGQRDEFSWGVTPEDVLVLTWTGDYIEKWDITIQRDILLLESKQNDGMKFTYQRVANEGHEELIGRWGWSTNQDWYYLFEMDGYGSRPDSYFLSRDEFIWFLLADGGLILRIGEEAAEQWDFEIDYDMLTLSSRQERGIIFHYIRLE